ncbi:hypothetical protein O7626_14655 [Micromonospora sp. WMMD1102]|uniref:hypothetical protein n=1 Tax=Micromonospora sp. WMMD1102 TaxID=3016105 RepID=UPI002414D5C7|nr:hypothetical protein [Micromonospora sp. WMMD1102]MDG4787156.1 hypothetical protein [Micromonospora sp. WMMD1102]
MTPQHPDWWLYELAYAGPEHLDPTYVDGYDRKAGHDPRPDLEILRRYGLDGDATLVDLGAEPFQGPGEPVDGLASVVEPVVAGGVEQTGEHDRGPAEGDGEESAGVVACGHLFGSGHRRRCRIVRCRVGMAAAGRARRVP